MTTKMVLEAGHTVTIGGVVLSVIAAETTARGLEVLTERRLMTGQPIRTWYLVGAAK